MGGERRVSCSLLLPDNLTPLPPRPAAPCPTQEGQDRGPDIPAGGKKNNKRGFPRKDASRPLHKRRKILQLPGPKESSREMHAFCSRRAAHQLSRQQDLLHHEIQPGLFGTADPALADPTAPCRQSRRKGRLVLQKLYTYKSKMQKRN